MVRDAARQDISRAEAWYLEHAPDHVGRFLDQLAMTVRLIRDNPALFRPLRHDARRATLQVFPYSVWYRVLDDLRVVEVLALVHERQDPETLISRYV